MKIIYRTSAFCQDKTQKRIMEDKVAGNIVFKEAGVEFASFGHRYLVAYKDVISIMNED